MVLVGALARLGAFQNPCLPIYRERELRFVLGQVRPSVFIVPGTWRGVDYAAMAQGIVEELSPGGLDCEVVVADPALPAGDPTSLAAAIEPPPSGEEEVRWVFFSSGTTADPKGAMHTDASIAIGAIGLAESFEITEADRYGLVFPFTHIGGIGMLVVQLLTGCAAIAIEQYDPEASPVIFARHGITISAGGTPMALLSLQAQRRHPDVPLYPDLRVVMGGAAPKPPGLHAEVQHELGGRGAVSVYGLTEAPLAAVSSVRDPDEKLAIFEGRANRGAELRIVAEDGTVSPPGGVGEIRVRGALVCRGYLDPARNVDAFDRDGFFRTGDLGSLDPDGYLAVTGRLKDVIIRKGENISAKDVEDVLYEHPAVAEVAVIGLPDAERGERACAVVVVRDGSDPLDLPSIASFCREHGLAVQKIPEQLELMRELPRNASGKVLKYKLQEQFS
jgi:acyl-CoA synthetase (AMP-forming)/AMP-acid ligase II